MNRESEKRKTNREKGKSPIPRYACVHRDDIAFVVIASSWQTARIMHLDATNASCWVCWIEERKKNRHLGFAWSKNKNQPIAISTPISDSSHLLSFGYPLFAHPFSSSASASSCSPPSRTLNNTLISPPLHRHPSTTQSRAVRPNPNAMPRTIRVLEYDELSTCPYATQ